MKKLLICSTFILFGFMSQQADARLSCMAPEMGNEDPNGICGHADCMGTPDMSGTLECKAPMIACNCTK